jgi:outer membrane lipoprotein LolB
MRRRFLVWSAVGLVLAALGGCATPHVTPASAATDTLAVAGRLSLVSGAPDAQKALYGGFRLELRGADSGEFEVFSPLGQMLARARWSPGQASLNDGRQTHTYASFDAMTRAALGVALPQAALQDWVRGKPTSSLPAQQLADGAFEQLGWQVQPIWRDGRLVLLKAQRLGADPAELRMAIESTTPQDKNAGTAGGN